MSYTVLARKWRPKNFTELVGQAHVMQALSNALDQQRLHHAYLFTGTRGVGKTTIARVFAKALNCEKGITSQPCGVCSNCKSIDEGRFVDLIEVDAASKTKVDDTRELLDNVQYAAVQGRFKVYLIDEVHMLSKSSFNALLKTLEEPPEHVKFLLATTVPHKLPATVLSRCLQFNLMRLTQIQIANHLAFILQQEQIPYEESALAMIAKSADGSARDSLSILDQAIAFGAGEVKFAAVQAMLGLVDQQFTELLLQAMMAQSADALKDVLQRLAAMGVDYTALLAQLIEALHQVALVQILGGLGEVAVIDEAQLNELAEHLSPQQVQMFYQIALLARQDMRLAPDERIGFEMAMLRMLAFNPSAMPVENHSESIQKLPGLVKNNTQKATSDAQAVPDSNGSPAAQMLQSLKNSVQSPSATQAPVSQRVLEQPGVDAPAAAQADVARAPQITPQMPAEAPQEQRAEQPQRHFQELQARLQQTLGKPVSSTKAQAEVSSPGAIKKSLSDKMTAMMEQQSVVRSALPNPVSPSMSSAPVSASSMDEPPAWVNEGYDGQAEAYASEMAQEEPVFQPAPVQSLAATESMMSPPVPAFAVTESKIEPSLERPYVGELSAPTLVATDAMMSPPVPAFAVTESKIDPPFERPYVGESSAPTLVAQVLEPVLSEPSQKLPGLSAAVAPLSNVEVFQPPVINLADSGIEQWLALLEQLKPEGMAEALAWQSALVSYGAEGLVLCVAPDQAFAKTEMAVTRLAQTLQRSLGEDFQLQFVEKIAPEQMITPALYWENQKQQRQALAVESINQDPMVAEFQTQFNMRLIESSIKPIEIM